jgi:glucose-1-phosphate thymidylyltransferase
MRGVIMAGGSGSRLAPLTKTVNKQLLPVFDKPLIYYPLSTLMLAGIREFMLISSPSEIFNFQKLFGNGEQFGISIEYGVQAEPKGIAQGLLVAEKFITGQKVGFILGDNLFHGYGLGRQLAEHNQINGAKIFAYQVADPTSYGVVEINKDGLVVGIEEKPQTPKSNLAVTGLYFYDEEVVSIAKSLKPSARGELEITDVIKVYLERDQLSVSVLSRGVAWLDTGTFEGLHDASSYIKIVQERQSASIGNPFDVARTQGWIK